MSNEPIKIVSLEIENFKRIQVVELSLTPDGLVVIGGKNRQGKTSLVNAIASALGGAKMDPTKALRDGADKGRTVVTLSNGMVVEKRYTDKRSYLTVRLPEGFDGGQAEINEVITPFALDTGTFVRARPAEQAKILLQALGVDLTPYDVKEKELMAERTLVGQKKTMSEGHEKELAYHEDVGLEIKEPTDLLKELEEIVAHNAAVRRDTQHLEQLKTDKVEKERQIASARENIAEVQKRLAELEARLKTLDQEDTELAARIVKGEAHVGKLEVKDDSAIKARMASAEAYNAKVRENIAKKEAAKKTGQLEAEYSGYTEKIEALREDRLALLTKSGLPLPGLTVENDRLLYNGKEFDCMSGAEQLIVATAVCRKIKPEMGFVLVDQLERMDLDSLREFAEWAKKEKLQVIGTRVSSGSECQIIIEDGMIASDSTATAETANAETTEYSF